MKIEINYSNDGKTYEIFTDGKKLISCDATVDPNYALEAFGIIGNIDPLANAKSPKLTEDYILDVIGQVKFDTPNLVKTNDALSNAGSINLTKSDEISDPEFEENDADKLPIKINQKVYVDDVKGVLRSINGGLATINMIWIDPSENQIQTGTEFHDDHDEDEEDDFSTGSTEEPIMEKQIMFGIKEAEGVFFSWTILKDQQEQLKLQFGKTDASINYPTATV